MDELLIMSQSSKCHITLVCLKCKGYNKFQTQCNTKISFVSEIHKFFCYQSTFCSFLEIQVHALVNGYGIIPDKYVS